MKKMALLLSTLLATNAHAAGGFLWLGELSQALGASYVDHIFTKSFVAILILLIALAYRLRVSKMTLDETVVPDKGITLRNLVEMYGSFIYTQCRAVLGEEDAPKYFKFIAFLFITIFLANVIGLIPGFLPPTEYINTTLALGVLSFVYYNIKGCKELGTMNYLAHFAGPLWYMAILIFPIEILSNFIRPFS